MIVIVVTMMLTVTVAATVAVTVTVLLRLLLLIRYCYCCCYLETSLGFRDIPPMLLQPYNCSDHGDRAMTRQRTRQYAGPNVVHL